MSPVSHTGLGWGEAEGLASSVLACAPPAGHSVCGHLGHFLEEGGCQAGQAVTGKLLRVPSAQACSPDRRVPALQRARLAHRCRRQGGGSRSQVSWGMRSHAGGEGRRWGREVTRGRRREAPEAEDPRQPERSWLQVLEPGQRQCVWAPAGGWAGPGRRFRKPPVGICGPSEPRRRAGGGGVTHPLSRRRMGRRRGWSTEGRSRGGLLRAPGVARGWPRTGPRMELGSRPRAAGGVTRRLCTGGAAARTRRGGLAVRAEPPLPTPPHLTPPRLIPAPSLVSGVWPHPGGPCWPPH